MRRTRWSPIAAVLLVASISVAGSPPRAGAEGAGPEPELPAGFTDGEPVGPATGAPPAGTDGGGDGASRSAAVTQRYFGSAPWRAIEAAAAATPRTCGITDAGLVALVVSPVFKESSAATTPSSAPSPMTLSRYDEWSGTFGTDTNANANHGLYAFADPTSAYPRAFWHPGIGIWQYDTAGVGAPFTAIERMDVAVVAADVAKAMAARYCNPSAALVGHGAPFSDQERRWSAWAPWGYPCAACESLFQDLTASTPDFENVTLVSGISTTGGAVRRTCTLADVAGTVPCWYVDPSVGVIEGATAWATLDPSGGSPTVAPTPLALPFYVVDRGTTEERHWLRADTGYGIDISGSRTIGKNDRPRSNQAGSGVRWNDRSGLCDVTVGRGACVPEPPAGVTSTAIAITGLYRTIPLDAHGDGKGDVLLYAPGSAPDRLLSGRGSGAFDVSDLQVNGTYDHVLALDVDADGDDDVLWHQRSTGATVLWVSRGDGTFASVVRQVAAGVQPLVVDTNGDQRDEILWYGPGAIRDERWAWNGTTFTVRSMPVSGRFQPFTGDFDGDGRTDVYWYAPGSAPDYVWYFTGATSKVSVSRPVSGTYVPVRGDVDGDGRTDVLWYAAGPTAESLWFGEARRTFTNRPMRVDRSYQPVVADLEGDGRDDLVLYAPGAASDTWWRWSADRALTSAPLLASGTQRAVVGAFSAGGADGILWYGDGAVPDAVWWR